MFRKVERIHFVGIGGIGMSGIAEVLHNLGYAISGSDLADSEITRRLARLGVRYCTGHQAENVAQADVVVVSSAVTATNVEVVTAKACKIPVIPRAEMLAELMRMKYGVASREPWKTTPHYRDSVSSGGVTSLSSASLHSLGVMRGSAGDSCGGGDEATAPSKLNRWWLLSPLFREPSTLQNLREFRGFHCFLIQCRLWVLFCRC